MKPILACIPVAGLIIALPGCGSPPADGPPEFRLGDSVCDECNMIISDSRWATSTIVEGPRGPSPLLFDDFNCQVTYEAGHPDLVVLNRWSHSFATGSAVRTSDAVFLMSPNVRSPMGSHVAAFESSDKADAAQAELSGDVMRFDVAWKRLGLAGACCDADQNDQPETDKEHVDGP